MGLGRQDSTQSRGGQGRAAARKYNPAVCRPPADNARCLAVAASGILLLACALFPAGGVGPGNGLPAATLTASPSPAAIEQVPPLVFSDFLYTRQELRASAEETVRLINEERRQAATASLAIDPALTDLAFVRSEDMIARDYFAHEDPLDGSVPAHLLLPAAGFGGMLSEILFATTAPLDDVPSAALDWWRNSDIHRRNLLEPRFHMVGIGLMGDGTWWKVTGLLAEAGP